MSAADRVKYSYIAEVTPGLTPVLSPAFKALRITGESLKVMFQNDQSKELDPLRVEREQIIVGQSSGGDLNHEFLWDAHLDFIEAVLGGTLTGTTTKTVDNGLVLRYFSILKQFQDLTDINHLFKGMAVNSWTLTMPKKGIITGVFGLMGMGFANGAMPLGLTTPTFGVATDTDPMNSSSHLTSILLDDVPFTSCVDAMSLSITNDLRPQECLGSAIPTGFTAGKIKVTGTADIYFKDETLFNKYKNSQSFSWNMVFTDNNADTIAFDLSRVKFEDMDIVAGGTGQDVVAKCKFRALYDPTDTRVIRITQTNTP